MCCSGNARDNLFRSPIRSKIERILVTELSQGSHRQPASPAAQTVQKQNGILVWNVTVDLRFKSISWNVDGTRQMAGLEFLGTANIDDFRPQPEMIPGSLRADGTKLLDAKK